MHPNLSIVICVKNAVQSLGPTLESFTGLTDDILVFDTGSTDGSPELARKLGARTEYGTWEGFGPTKNKANALAKYDWILSLDADEALDEVLKSSLAKLEPESDQVVYELKFKTFLGNRQMRFGEWGHDRHIRLFNRRQVSWNNALVHESLVIPPGCIVKQLPGHVIHRTVSSIEEYASKLQNYASLHARNYYETGKKVGPAKKYLSSCFSFFRNYFLRLGFLDGWKGYQLARLSAGYTFSKYKLLEELHAGRLK